MTEKLLLINDLAGYGKVALGAMMPVLTHMGYDIYTLPTALVSNTLDYGKFEILDTTDYIAGTLRVWDELGFSFDAVSTGFIRSSSPTFVPSNKRGACPCLLTQSWATRASSTTESVAGR